GSYPGRRGGPAGPLRRRARTPMPRALIVSALVVALAGVSVAGRPPDPTAPTWEPKIDWHQPLSPADEARIRDGIRKWAARALAGDTPKPTPEETNALRAPALMNALPHLRPH